MIEPIPARPARPARQPVAAAAREAVEAAAARVAAAAGATLHDDACGPQCVLPDRAPAQALAGGFVAPLADLSVLTVRGADAVPFLHAQLTNDVAGLAAGAVRLTGYCSPKGRLLATWTLWRDTDAVRLLGAQPMAATLATRLGMFVLRAQVTVHDDAATTALIGVAGARGADALAALGVVPPEPMCWRSLDMGAEFAASAETPTGADTGVTVIGLQPVPTPVGEQARWVVALPLARFAEVWQTLARHAPAAGSLAWRWLEVLSGTPRIAGGAVDRFVPQMINLEVAGGVDFRKGCYPGQEIVARSQYLGKLKRRMFAAHVEAAEPAPGADVLADGVAEPVGQVVLAAPDPAGGAVVLFEVPVDRAEGGTVLRLAPDGAPLVSGSLPYAMPK